MEDLNKKEKFNFNIEREQADGMLIITISIPPKKFVTEEQAKSYLRQAVESFEEESKEDGLVKKDMKNYIEIKSDSHGYFTGYVEMYYEAT